MNNNDFLIYEAPQVDVVEVEVEKGFTVSDPESMPYGNPW